MSLFGPVRAGRRRLVVTEAHPAARIPDFETDGALLAQILMAREKDIE